MSVREKLGQANRTWENVFKRRAQASNVCSILSEQAKVRIHRFGAYRHILRGNDPIPNLKLCTRITLENI